LEGERETVEPTDEMWKIDVEKVGSTIQMEIWMGGGW